MSQARSLRRDLAFGLGAELTSLWIVATLGAAWVVRKELDEVYDSLIQEIAARVLLLSTDHNDAALPPQAEALLTWVLKDADGVVLRRPEEADPRHLHLRRPEGSAQSVTTVT